MPADCEVEIRGGAQCGVIAVGRCWACGRAFCPSHQAQVDDARAPRSTPVLAQRQSAVVPNLCAPCQVASMSTPSDPPQTAAAARRAAGERKVEAQRNEVADLREQIQAILDALSSAGSPGLLHRTKVVREGRKRLLGKQPDEIVNLPGVWPCGTGERSYLVDNHTRHETVTQSVNLGIQQDFHLVWWSGNDGGPMSLGERHSERLLRQLLGHPSISRVCLPSGSASPSTRTRLRPRRSGTATPGP